ncbi:MAG: FAD-dependent oxidoreductase, partial [Proteobacteria bacterium]|nr:FAD-dependent oxidoreductase [Pseudomonadota bacterium]
ALGFVLDEAGRAVVGTTAEKLEESGCRFCTACVEVCPTGALMDRDLKRGAKEDRLEPCRAACPAGIDVPEYVRLVAQGKADQALAIIRERVPLPGILGRVCVHPCEDACRRGEINDPISICALKRFAADQGSDGWQAALPSPADTGKRVAVIGAGPAGLAAAFYLRQKGHAVTVFEAMPLAGGMMRYGIPSYRLPDVVLDKEINDIEATGVQIRLNQKIDDALALKAEYDAVFIGVGAGFSHKIPLEGRDKDGVLWGLDFLRDVRLGQGADLTGQRVIVIGGGNVAVDVALTAFRQGAAAVALACLEKRDEMPAFEWEIQGAMDEGVELHCSWGPSLIKGDGRVSGLDFIRCTSVFDDQGVFNPAYDESDSMSLDGDAVILAIGQATDLSLVPEGGPVKVERGAIVADEKSQATGQNGIFVGGDAWRYPGAIIDAIAAGRRAASAIDNYLGGDGDIELRLTEHVTPDPNIGRIEGFADLTRVEVPCLDPTTRVKNFDEIFTGFSQDQAQAESGRCLQCDLRLYIAEVPTPPQAVFPLDDEHVAAIPDDAEGVYILYNEEREVLVIKGTATLKDELLAKLESGSSAKFFEWEEDKMYSQAESERLQAYLSAHGQMPVGDGADELDDLF